ncbi:MAG: cation:proton antiporter [Candidatus Cloacimonetes bacterium]|nr:cation:proton antiporter [Candidatus Cloacimonadota bacterium]MBS3767771.1 cation:proton antiporter [Candidatus Cloacimonadota bacterium]
MDIFASIEQNISFPPLLIIGLLTILSFYFGKAVKKLRLPLIIGYMVVGVFLGPSFLDIINETFQQNISFITEIALGFVAFSIGLELKFSSLKKIGPGIILIILFESFGAFILVFLGLYLLTGNLPLSLVFAAIAPASAPAGTVAVIQEYKAKGKLTQALYAVVGFDDGLGIVIFGFTAAIARIILVQQTGSDAGNTFFTLLTPLKEISLSIILGVVLGFIFSLLARKVKNANELLILIFAFVLVDAGISTSAHLSPILSNMVIGMFVVNTQSRNVIRRIYDRLPVFLPLLFILFFTLAGANLHIAALPSLGLIGIVYIILRSLGLIAGSRLGGIMGKVDRRIRKYIGLGILSQAGVAIGLALIVKHEFSDLGPIISSSGKQIMTAGEHIGVVLITTITATCIFFELIGPILTKIALKKAGEISDDEDY